MSIALLSKKSLFILFILSVCMTSLEVLAEENVSEYSLKAAVVFAMPMFIEWPKAKNSGYKNATFNLCVYGKSPLVDELSRLEGRIIKNDKLVVVSINDQTENQECRILVITKGANTNRAELIQKFQNNSTLLIGEEAEPPADQMMINLLMENGKVIFQANPQLAKSEGIKLSSKLLRLAKVIYP